jgi:CrcB protein
MIKYLVIGFGGALGAIARVITADLLPSKISENFPMQILLVNILGCFLMGISIEWLGGVLHVENSHLKNFLIAGFLGGFTTFSSFALEFGQLVEKNVIGTAILHVVISVATALTAFFFGVKLARAIIQ